MGKRKKPKFYVVWEGARPGIYTNWPDCQLQIQGYKGARYKAFSSIMEEAKTHGTGDASMYQHLTKMRDMLSKLDNRLNEADFM